MPTTTTPHWTDGDEFLKFLFGHLHPVDDAAAAELVAIRQRHEARIALIEAEERAGRQAEPRKGGSPRAATPSPKKVKARRV